MPKYVKETSRIEVKFINADTEEELFVVKNRNWMNIGEILSSTYSDLLIQRELKGKTLPKNVLILVVSELTLVN